MDRAGLQAGQAKFVQPSGDRVPCTFTQKRRSTSARKSTQRQRTTPFISGSGPASTRSCNSALCASVRARADVSAGAPELFGVGIALMGVSACLPTRS